jgi:hypothetical protein
MRRTRRLASEQLESRTMLAGNVTAWVDGGTLFLRGNVGGNGIAIEQLDTGRYAVIPFDVAGTTFLNGTAGARAFGGVTNDIDINLGHGGNVLVMGNKPVTNQLIANDVSNNRAGVIPANPFAVNNQNVTPDFLRVPRNLNITTLNGWDGVGTQVQVGRPHFGGVINIDTGLGSDRIRMQVASAENNLHVRPGPGNDHVHLNYVAAFNLVNIDFAGGGTNTLRAHNVQAGHAHVKGGNGHDTMDLQNWRVRRELAVWGFEGNDSISLDGGNANILEIHTHGGNDAVFLRNFRVWDDAIIDMGSGTDFASIINVQVDDFALVQMGDGSDELEVGDSRAREALLDGGAGFDTFRNLGGNSLNARVVNFENHV